MVFLFILFSIIILIVISKINVEIRNLDIRIQEPKLLKNKDDKTIWIKDKYVVKIKIKILNFLPIIKVIITKEKIKKMSQNKKYNKINKQLKSIKNNTSLKEIKETVHTLNIKVKELYLKSEIGLDSVMALTYIIPIISTIISALLVNKQVDQEKQFYEIKPIYNRRKFTKYKVRRYI